MPLHSNLMTCVSERMIRFTMYETRNMVKWMDMGWEYRVYIGATCHSDKNDMR